MLSFWRILSQLNILTILDVLTILTLNRFDHRLNFLKKRGGNYYIHLSCSNRTKIGSGFRCLRQLHRLRLQKITKKYIKERK